MTADRILEMASSRGGFALYPEMDASTHRAAASLVRRGQVTERRIDIRGQDETWTIVLLHRVTK